MLIQPFEEANNTMHVFQHNVSRIIFNSYYTLVNMLGVTHPSRWGFWPAFCILASSFAIAKGVSLLLPLLSPSVAQTPDTATLDDVRHVLVLPYSGELSLAEQGGGYAIPRS